MSGLRVGLASASRSRTCKIGWYQAAADALGHRTERLASLAEIKESLSPGSGFDAVIFDQFSFGLSDSELEEFVAFAHARRRISEPPYTYQWIIDLIDRDPTLTIAQQIAHWVPVMSGMSCCWTKERTLRHMLALHELRINTAYLDQGCPSWMPACEHRESPEFDLLVLGSAWPQRLDVVRSLLPLGLRIAWAGPPAWSRPLIPAGVEVLPYAFAEELPALVSRAKAALSVDYRSDVPGYRSDRFWLLAGMGAVVIHRGPGVAGVGTINFANRRQLLNRVLAWTQATAAERAALGASCRAAVLRAHTYEYRLARWLPPAPESGFHQWTC